MGKKKRRGDAFGSEDNKRKKKKRHSDEGAFASDSTPRPTRKIRYEDMPLNYKRKFYINDDCGSLTKYVEVISWIRTMVTLNGTVFEEIPNMHCLDEEYPLLEVEIVSPNNISSKFIIFRMSLYVVAFFSQNKWYQFNFDRSIEIVPFEKLPASIDGKYTSTPWQSIGPSSMITALETIANPSVNLTTKACAAEVFFVHFSEAARFYPIESLVCGTLIPIPGGGGFDNITYEDEAEKLFSRENGRPISEQHDVYSLVKANGPVNLEVNTKTPDYIRGLLKHFSDMSKSWYLYSLTGKRLFHMKPDHVSFTHMRSVKSLRCTLAVLCNTNLDKILGEWVKKKGSHDTLTCEVYDEMEKQVRELKAQRKVLG